MYCGGRLFDFLEPWWPGVAALVSPLILASAPALGFEWSSYVCGIGTWAQLWGMWALPFWGALVARGLEGLNRFVLAALVLGITVCLHLLSPCAPEPGCMGVAVAHRPPALNFGAPRS